ncbi:MAG: type IX secretion system protein PorQ [Flavobacteriales bacterium]|mgnify:CR=1 FL=1|nr:type IX secretion system protein PorQ [Flavobacteriales bacterium]MBK9196816.1 type IX secretion system protein PorQ [Flavobacteriales bacterium]MBP6573227.1 type IX secretion system protein PorQ [Flavobacteriales bacterium]
MTLLRLPATVFGCSALLTASAQLGGQTSFNVLDIPSSARVAALGGNNIAVQDADINLGFYNPALLNKEMERQVALSYLRWFNKADINLGYVGYAHHFDSCKTTVSAAFQFVDYGEFRRTDDAGVDLGSFTAGEYALQVGASRPIDSLFTVGVNAKVLFGQLEEYTSTAVAFDVGGLYHKPGGLFTLAAMLRNIGYQTSAYTERREKLPFQVQIGTTYKFRHAPFRLGLMLENLQKWDLTYDDPNAQVNIDPTTGEVITEKVTFMDKALLHVIGNVEILLGKNLHVRFGYNYRRRQELSIEEKPGLAGISFGAGIRVAKIHVSYGYAQYHLAGASNSFTVAVRFNDFKKQPVLPPAAPEG